jgi:hypothetical protein
LFIKLIFKGLFKLSNLLKRVCTNDKLNSEECVKNNSLEDSMDKFMGSATGYKFCNSDSIGFTGDATK